MFSKEKASNKLASDDLYRRLDKINQLMVTNKKEENARGTRVSRETVQYFLKVKKEMESERKSRSRSRDSSLSNISVKSNKSNVAQLKTLSKQVRSSSIDGRNCSNANHDILFLVRDNKIIQVDPIWRQENKPEAQMKRESKSPKLYKKCISPIDWREKRDLSSEKKTASSSLKSASLVKSTTATKNAPSKEIPGSVVNKILNFFNENNEKEDPKSQPSVDSSFFFSEKKTEKMEDRSICCKEPSASLDFLNLKNLNSLANLVKPHKTILFNLSLFFILLEKAPKYWAQTGDLFLIDANLWKDIQSLLKNPNEVITAGIMLEQRIKENKVDEKSLELARNLLRRKDAFIPKDQSLSTFYNENPFSDIVKKMESFIEETLKKTKSQAVSYNNDDSNYRINIEKESQKSKVICKMVGDFSSGIKKGPVPSEKETKAKTHNRTYSSNEKPTNLSKEDTILTDRPNTKSKIPEKYASSISDKKKSREGVLSKTNKVGRESSSGKGRAKDQHNKIENQIERDIDKVRKEIVDIETKRKKIIALHEREVKLKEKKKEIEDINAEILRKHEEERKIAEIIQERKSKEKKYLSQMKKEAHENAISARMNKYIENELRALDEHQKNSEDRIWRKNLEIADKEKKTAENREKDFSFSVKKEALNQTMVEDSKKEASERKREIEKVIQEKKRENDNAKKELDRKLEQTLNLINRIKLTSD